MILRQVALGPDLGISWTVLDDLMTLLAMRHGVGEGQAALAEQLWHGAKVWELARLPRWAPSRTSWAAARRQHRALTTLGLHALLPADMPRWLRVVRPRPLLLFVRGEPALLRRRGTAIIGARCASAAGFAWAWARGHLAAAAGDIVISGGAQGCDAAAHLGALAAGGTTCAYLGVAIDRIFPAEHRGLFSRILDAGGALVSEYPPGARLGAWAHAARNRFIAAQARVLLIAEADHRSGSLGTARYARKFGVPIQVSPDRVGQRREGLDWLVKQGWADVVSDGREAPDGSAPVAQLRLGV